MRRDNAAGGDWSGMFRCGLATVGEHVCNMASARRDGTARVHGEMERQRQRGSVGCVGMVVVEAVWRGVSVGREGRRRRDG